jgi:hypothetical protein
MVYVVERYLPGLSRSDLLPRLSRLEPVIEELRRDGSLVRYLGSTIVLEDEACFCHFEASSTAAVIEANRRADLSFDRIVPAVLVQPTPRSGEMSTSTSIPTTAGRRRFHPLPAITAIAAVIALTAWAIATYAVNSAMRSVSVGAPTQASVLRQLTPAEREYVLGVVSMSPAEVRAAFGTNPPRSVASPLRSLTLAERRYVLGIASLTPLQLWAAFGTTPAPPLRNSGVETTTPSGAPTSPAAASPILPACGAGACWHAAASNASSR